ncbi:MAG: hypothetical protein U0359_32560 [Byssovorax sp.]
MALLMPSVIRHYLKHAESYVSQGTIPLPIDLDAEGEEIVGWYRNPPPFEDDYVAFTTVGIYARAGGVWTRLPFDDIVDYELPQNKEKTNGVRVRAHDGTRFIRFAGRSGPSGKFSDAFILLGLLRVVALANRRRIHGASRN